MQIKNFDKVEATTGEFELIPVGRYDLMITNAVNKVSASGNDYIALDLKILNDDDEKSYFGRKLWANINNNDIGRGILKSILVFNESSIAHQKGDFDFEPSVLIGMKVNGKVTIKTDPNYGDKNEVKYFKKVSPDFEKAIIDIFTANSSTTFANKAPSNSPF